MDRKIQLLRGDITKIPVDAIVNAANSSLLGGGGVDGAIHRAAGPELLEECRKLNGCPTGMAKITRAYNLPAKYVIHTVGPVWQGGLNREDELLRSCYASSLRLARESNCTSIAFPNISTGVYRFPKNKAASIAVSEVEKFVRSDDQIQKVVFVCFDEENYGLYSNLLDSR